MKNFDEIGGNLTGISTVCLLNTSPEQGYTDSRHQITQVTELCAVAANICGYSLRNLHYATLLTPRSFRRCLGF